jgi:hypothetical protein
VIDLFGTLNSPELLWLLSNVVGLILAVAATGEAIMDHEAVRILGRRGTIAGADVRARLLKASGNRRDEAIKAVAHAVMLTIGIIVSASPTPRQEYEAFTALWSALAVIVVAIALSFGSVYSLRDRRLLWQMFETEDDDALEDDAERAAVATTPEHVPPHHHADAALAPSPPVRVPDTDEETP